MPKVMIDFNKCSNCFLCMDICSMDVFKKEMMESFASIIRIVALCAEHANQNAQTDASLSKNKLFLE